MEADGPPVQDPNFRKGLVAAVTWVALNVCLSIVNKWLFNNRDFHYPVFIILTGLIVASIGSGVFLFVFRKQDVPSREILRKHWLLFLLTAVFHGGSTVLENVAIDNISISLNQVIKATTPAYTMVLSYLLEGRRYSPRMQISMASLIVGASLTTFHNPSYSFFGIMSSLVSCWMNVIRMMMMGRLLQEVHVSPIAVTFMTALPASLSLVPVFMIAEMSDLLAQASSKSTEILIVLGMNWVAFAYLLVGLILMNYTGPHYSAVIANLKVVILVIVSSQLFHTHFTNLNLVGLGVAFIAFCCYNLFKVTDETRTVSSLAAASSPSALSSLPSFHVAPIVLDESHSTIISIELDEMPSEDQEKDHTL